jgi:arylsulfatase A-like enzyme
MIRNIFHCLALIASTAAIAQGQPNIVIIWGDDIGYWNISAYDQGALGCGTPNIDRIARQGAIFTAAYGEHSGTAGRAAFITGQSPFRIGLTEAVLPGEDFGLQDADPTIAEYLKTKGYMTAQYGKNHLGDRDHHLPTNHGFDEFFGSLFPFNGEQETEIAERPKKLQLDKRNGPRGVIKSFSDGRIEDTGPLSHERMETLDAEVTTGAIEFIERAHEAGTPFFLWWNSTRMQIATRPQYDSEGRAGPGIYPPRVVEHDSHVGQVLDKLDELGLAENTLVIYSTDNGADVFSSPDGGTTPFRSEKNQILEGGFRVPMLVRWPSAIEPGTQINEIISHMDWFPTIAAALGDDDIKEQLKKGMRFGNKRFRVHLDGYNIMPFLRDGGEWPRQEFFYFSDTGALLNLRHNDWKIVFAEQERRAPRVEAWSDPFVLMHAPRLINLREDPNEQSLDESTGHPGWYLDRLHVLAPAQEVVGEFLISFEQFPPRDQTPARFSLARLMEKLKKSTN